MTTNNVRPENNGLDDAARVGRAARGVVSGLGHSPLQNHNRALRRPLFRGPFSWVASWVMGIFLALLIIPYKRWGLWRGGGGQTRQDERKGRLDRFFARVVRRFVAPVPREYYLTGPQELNQLIGWFTHPLVEEVRREATSSLALEAVYQASGLLRQEARKNWWRPWRWPGILFGLWLMNTCHPEAVRNRLRIVHREYLQALRDRWAVAPYPDIRVLALASGSAHALLFALRDFLTESPGAAPYLRATLVDLSPKSLELARKTAEELGLPPEVLSITEGNILKFIAAAPSGHYHVVECVGFFDYRELRQIAELAQSIRRVTASHGVFIGAQILRTNWDFMLRYAIGWPMLIHRTPEQYNAALTEGGWHNEEGTLTVEPCGGHVVSVYRKSS